MRRDSASAREAAPASCQERTLDERLALGKFSFLAAGAGKDLVPRLEELATETASPPANPGLALAPSARLELRAGARLKHYEIIRKLGEGGMGSVLLARAI